MRKRITLILTIAALAGCHMPSPLSTAHDERTPDAVVEAPARTAPSLSGRISFGARHLQADLPQIAKAATVALINSGSNQTVSTALTNAAGEFILDFSNGYTADPTAVYYLEAIKGLGGNLPSHDAVRIRTIVKYQDGWTSLTNTTPNQSIVVNPSTTALAIGAGIRKGEAGFSFDSLIGTLSGELSNVYTPINGLSLSDFEALAPLVSTVLASDRDPIRSIGLLAPSTWHRLDQGLGVSAIAPTQGPAGTSVVVSGFGFTSTPADHAVSFNGITASVSTANPMSLTSSVPTGATSGETAVRIGKLMALGPIFTVPVSITSLSSNSGPVGASVTIVGSGFSTTPESNLVRFNGVQAKVTAATPTQLTVTVPVTTSGPVTLAVSGVSAEGPRFIVPVSVTSLNPSSSMPGTTVTIAGSGFSTTPESNLVRFNGVQAKVTAATPTQLTVTVPVTTSGPVTLAVSGESATGPSFTYESMVLRALHPEAAAPGTSLMLEGTFPAPVTVNFPGVGAVAAEVLGPRRAKVVVPPGASSGNLTLSSGSVVTNALHFQALGAAPGLGSFGAGASLGESRNRASLVRAENHLFLVGGSRPIAPSGTEYRAEVFRATIGPDDSIGAFTATGASLLTPRQGQTAQVIGEYLYVMGGSNASATRLASVERARIHSDGSLEAFEDAGIALTLPRLSPSSEIVGHYLYVFGGTPSQASVERAVIQPDGTLGAFEGTGLTFPAVHGHSSVVIGDYVYVFGGSGQGSPPAILNTVRRASIQPDGTLGEFQDAGVTLNLATFTTACVRLGTGLYLLGGENTTGEARNVIQRAEIHPDGTLGAFANMGALGTLLRQHTHAIVGDRVYLFGGNAWDRYNQSLVPLAAPYSAPITAP